MTTPETNKYSFKKLPEFKRKHVKIAKEELFQTSFLQAKNSLPLVITSSVKGVNLAVWANSNQDFIDKILLKHGAIVFRGFNVNGAIEFEEVIKSISGELLEYHERSSPRSLISGRIYTSTDYPAEQSIFLHNEHSYSTSWPMKLFFYCVTPAHQGGETLLADSRKIFEHIDPTIRNSFIQKKWMYVRNFGDRFGLSWQTAFQTTDKTVVEKYCRANDIEFEWKDKNRLKTRQVREAAVRHPRTGEMVWFNHLAFFHVSILEPTVSNALLAEFEEQDLPNNTYYGDGSPIKPSVLDKLREAYCQEAISFPWQEGDILLIDNMLTSHGRAPFIGPRKVLVGMAEPFSWETTFS